MKTILTLETPSRLPELVLDSCELRSWRAQRCPRPHWEVSCTRRLHRHDTDPPLERMEHFPISEAFRVERKMPAVA